MMHSVSFAIQTAADYLREVVLPDYNDFLNDNSSSRNALQAIIMTHHMYAWANDGKDFRIKLFTARYPAEADLAIEFDLARHIANGTKHFSSKPVTTSAGLGFSSEFSEEFARPLNITKADGSAISADQLLQNMVSFWERQKAAGAF
jgi:hypothetical protein